MEYQNIARFHKFNLRQMNNTIDVNVSNFYQITIAKSSKNIGGVLKKFIKIKKIHVKKGQTVEKGQVLIEFE